MNSPDAPDALRLKRLLKTAGLHSVRLDQSRRAVSFVGRAREWTIVVGLSADWFNATTVLCELPKEPGLRMRLSEWALGANRGNALVKFGILETSLALEIDYRAEHIDETTLPNFIGLLYTVAEAQYPRVFRIVTGEDVLKSLEWSLAPGGAS